MTRRIDLNADLGEGGRADHALMEVISSCNIACGGHAGDRQSMARAVRLAKAVGVCVGAHISFPDRENFGRVPMDMAGDDLEEALHQQLTALVDITDSEGVAITHVKPHGALYNMAAQSPGLADSVLAVMTRLLPGARLVGPPASEMERRATACSAAFRREGFADRAYEADGQLRDRRWPGAVLSSPEQQVAQAVQIACQQSVSTHGGATLALRVDTVCVHGDTPNALKGARAIRAALATRRIKICAP